MQPPEENREAKRSVIKREKNTAKNECMRNTSTDSKGTTFVILKNHTSAPDRKERLSPTSKLRSKAIRNKFMKTSGVPDRIEYLGEVDSSKNRPKTRPEFVKPIENGLRKKQNLIESRPSRAKNGLTGRKNEIRLQKGDFETD